MNGIEVQVGPKQKDGRRLVVAMFDGVDHRDKLDTDDSYKRQKFREAALAKFGLGDDSEAHSLIESELVRLADAEDSRPQEERFGEPVVLTMSNVKPQATHWLWTRWIPVAPEFCIQLEAVPKADRYGPVFKFVDGFGGERKPTADWVGRMVSRFGKRAGIRVNEDPRSGKVKFASVHDLRRSFGERWSRRIMPTELKEIMRHESLDTTMKYYVGQNAERTAKVLWEWERRTTVGAASKLKQEVTGA